MQKQRYYVGECGNKETAFLGEGRQSSRQKIHL